mmetsp:Transcript_61134/g.149656  ORF Transcript_61134/g.149656 Transcript_61134/m.149656 type:complete len:368 (-) Transcript_61134:124-1227(-)
MTAPTPMDIDTATTASASANMKNDLPWVEKYRPNKLSDLIAHEDIIRIIDKLIDSNNLPHLLLYGPPGTGKTSTIVAAAKKMYGEKKYGSMTLELNASDSRGIDVVRNEIKEFAGTKMLFGSSSSNVKLIILDEADAMTSDAQFALRRVIEKYAKNARFCLICNYVSKIIPALQSRCTRFRFAPLQPSQIQGRLEYVAKQENIDLKPDAIDAILNLSGGDMRRVLNLLQSSAMSAGSVAEGTTPSSAAGGNAVTLTGTDVYLTSGSPLPEDIDTILNILLNEQSFRVACEQITDTCSTKGYALADVLKDVALRIGTGTLKLDTPALARLLDGMSQVEERLASGTNESVQTASLVGVFVGTRQRLHLV